MEDANEHRAGTSLALSSRTCVLEWAILNQTATNYYRDVEVAKSVLPEERQ